MTKLDKKFTPESLAKFTDHRAAVKAIAWSPYRRGRFVSGGGTADRTLRFWDSKSLSCMGVVETGSQVCNVAWSSNIDEIVTTHGFSQNHIVIWDTASSTSSVLPTVKPAIPIATLRGHTSRVLHLAVSPDGRTIATAAGDQTLRFWNAFPSRNYGMSSCLPISTNVSSSLQPIPGSATPESGKRKSFAVKQQISDGQCLSGVSTALIPDCSMPFR